MSGHIEFLNADRANFTPVSAANPLPVTSIGADGTTAASISNPAPVTSGNPTSVALTILSGQTAGSARVNGKLGGIRFPATFNGSPSLTIAQSDDNASFKDVVDIVSGTVTARTFTTAQVAGATDKFLALALGDWTAITYIRLTASASQSADRVFTLDLVG